MKRLVARIRRWWKGPPPVPVRKVEITAAEFASMMASIDDGMAALRERIEYLETALMIETALLEAVVGHE
jgi:hypothetical protein